LKWLEITVEVESDEAAQAVGALFDRWGEGGAVYEQVCRDQLDLASSAESPTNLVKAYLPATAGTRRIEALEKELCDIAGLHSFGPPRFKELEDKDWATAWRAFFQPQYIGARLLVKLPDQVCLEEEDRLCIDLEPGMAFGTGLHETTRRCLLCLEDLIRPGDCVLDMGTGSGILAIAAARLGAGQVLALDSDPTAVAVAQENVCLNGVRDVVQVREGSLGLLTHEEPRRFDGILLNIITEVIVEMIDGDLNSFLRPGGWLVASGILASAGRKVTSLFKDKGMTRVQLHRDQEWLTLCGLNGSTEARGRPGGA
jgi:ribosomal protein L11 methyltransferase